jgi:serine/threonine protein kinase
MLHDGGVVELEVRLAITVSMAEGLAYLHHDYVSGIIHRDVKAENISSGSAMRRASLTLALPSSPMRVPTHRHHRSPGPTATSHPVIKPSTHYFHH